MTQTLTSDESLSKQSSIDDVVATHPKLISPQSEMSDCGYVTQMDNPELMSTSSNEDDKNPRAHQKPPTNQKQRFNAANNPRSAITVQEKKERRRKKLMKRNKSSL